MVALKDSLNQRWENYTYHTNISLIDWIQIKKMCNESDNIYPQKLNTFKTQIRNKAKNVTKIEVKFFYTGLNKII